MLKALQTNGALKGLFLGSDRLVNPSMALGFGFHLAWVYMVIYMAFPSSFFDNQPLEALFHSLGAITWAVTILVMLLMALVIDRITYIIRRQDLQISIACVMSVGTILLFVSEYVPSIPLVVAGDILAGASAAFLFLFWGEAFRRQETPSIVANAILSCIIALFSCGVMTALLPVGVTGAVLCVMPLFVITGLFFVMHGENAFFSKQEFFINDEGRRVPIYGIREIPTFRKLRVRRSLLLLRLAVPGLLFGMAFGPLTLQTSTLILDPLESSTGVVGTITVACTVALALVIVLLALNRDEGYLTFYRFIIPVLAITIFFTSFQGDGFTLSLFTFIAFICFSFMLWAEFSELSRRYRISPILVFGFGLASVMAAQFVSTLVLETVHIDHLFSTNGSILNTFLILTMLLGYFLLPRDNAIREMSIMDYPDPSGTGEAATSSGEPGKGHFVARCEYVANAYLLSSRETDVLYLLAKGRNAAYVAKKLFISEGTVHTHTWRIYRKLNVHTQQELMDLVESYFIHDDGRVEQPAEHPAANKPPKTRGKEKTG
jgi:DNA-binding CsgD family transcriptional regulator